MPSVKPKKQVKPKQVMTRTATFNEMLEAGGGGKDFRTRERIPLLAPFVKWYALGLLGTVVSFCALYIKMKK